MDTFFLILGAIVLLRQVHNDAPGMPLVLIGYFAMLFGGGYAIYLLEENDRAKILFAALVFLPAVYGYFPLAAYIESKTKKGRERKRKQEEREKREAERARILQEIKRAWETTPSDEEIEAAIRDPVFQYEVWKNRLSPPSVESLFLGEGSPRYWKTDPLIRSRAIQFCQSRKVNGLYRMMPSEKQDGDGG